MMFEIDSSGYGIFHNGEPVLYKDLVEGMQVQTLVGSAMDVSEGVEGKWYIQQGSLLGGLHDSGGKAVYYGFMNTASVRRSWYYL